MVNSARLQVAVKLYYDSSSENFYQPTSQSESVLNRH